MPRRKNIPRRQVRRLVHEPMHLFPGGSQTRMLPYLSHPLALHSFRSLRGDLITPVQAQCAETLVDAITRVHASHERYESANPSRSIIIFASRFGGIVSAAVRPTPAEAVRAAILVNPHDIEGGAFITNFRLGEEEATMLTRAGRDPGQKDRRFSLALVPDLVSEAEIAIAGKKGVCSIFENRALGALSPDMLLATTRSFTALGDLFSVSTRPTVPEVSMDGSVAQRMRGDPTRLGGSNMLNLMLAWAIGSVSPAAAIAAVEDGVLVANASGYPNPDRAYSGVHTQFWQRTQKVVVKHQHLAAYSNQAFDGPSTLLGLSTLGVHLLLAPRAFEHDDVSIRGVVDLSERMTFITLPKNVLE